MKTLKHRYQNDPIAIGANTKARGKDLVGAFLILTLSVFVVIVILMPETLSVFDRAIDTNGLMEWASAVGGFLIAGFLVVFPGILVVQGLIEYRNAHDLEQLGTLTTGTIIEKWIDLSEGRGIYYVSYQYLADRSASQPVSERVFQSLEHGQSIEVLHLQRAPHISRLKVRSL